MRVTLDTNVLVSGTFWTGDSFRILKQIDEGKLTCILSKDITKEYDRVIRSEEIIDKIDSKGLVLSKISQRIIRNSLVIDPKIKIDAIKEDASDNKVLECAVEGKADYIISQDNHLLILTAFEGIRIISPREFIKNILAEKT